MNEKPEKTIELTAAAVLGIHTVGTLLTLLQTKGVITAEEADQAVIAASEKLHKLTVGLTVDQTEDLIDIFLGRRITLPDRHLN